MPLTAQDKNRIATAALAASQATITSAAALTTIGAAGLGVIFLPIALGLAAEFNKVRFPRLSPGDIARAAVAAQQGSRISRDPFFGDIVISTPDQAHLLTGLVRDSAIRRVAALQDHSRAFLERRALTEALAETAVERGFAGSIAEIEDLRGGVFRPRADLPLEFREGNFLA